MGLDVSHNAFSGAYSAFNRLRQAVAAATGDGGSYPPHWQYNQDGSLRKDTKGNVMLIDSFDEDKFYVGGDYTYENNRGLFEFLQHSDCDGMIEPDMCKMVADDLQALLPSVEKLEWESNGHLSRLGIVGTLQRFIDGCIAAHEANEPLEFA